jgi:hypothetical protein
MEAWPAALEASTLARALRGSVWAYPLVNAGHLLGVALLIGAIVPLDLRILGMWPTVPLPPLWRVLTRMAVIGLGLAGVCGALLFMTRAAAYVGEGLFVAKMIVVATGIVNALWLRAAVAARRPAWWAASRPPALVKGSALLSLAAWLAALTLGRLVGYF